MLDVLVAVVLSVVGLVVVIGRPGGEGDFRSDDALGAALVLR
jgi:hypothetical protein